MGIICPLVASVKSNILYSSQKGNYNYFYVVVMQLFSLTKCSDAVGVELNYMCLGQV